MEFAAAIEVEVNLVVRSNGKGRKEEDDGVSRGEWVKIKVSPLCPIYSTGKSITAVQKVTCSLHTIWPSTWRTWRLTVATHYAREKRDMITSRKNRPFRSETVHASL